MLRRACDIWGHAARFSAMTLHEVASERFSRGCPQSFSTLVSWQQGCSSECASDKLFGQETLRRASSSLLCGTALAKDRSKWGPCVQFYGFGHSWASGLGTTPLESAKSSHQDCPLYGITVSQAYVPQGLEWITVPRWR